MGFARPIPQLQLGRRPAEPGGSEEVDLMKTINRRSISRRAWIVFTVCSAMLLGGTHVATAQETLLYSFEPDLEGFFTEPPVAMTVSHETSGLGSTNGSNSMKVTHVRFNGFAGARTTNIQPGFLDPLGIDFLRFDLTNTNRFSPPDAVAGEDPTFANMSLTFFGDLPGNPTSPAQIQYLLVEEAVGNLEPGTHTIEIDLRNDAGALGSGGGLNVDTGEIHGYDDWIAAGFVPTLFQIYLNKSVSVSDPRFEWTIYIDNVRVGRDVVGQPGDFNGDGSVDAADYVVWRKNNGTNNALPNDNGLGTPIGPAHYDLWRQYFGLSPGGAAVAGPVPEPASMFLALFVAMFCFGTQRGRPVQ
jgi:hypothetical protein